MNQAARRKPHWEQELRRAGVGAGRGRRTGGSSTTARPPIPSGKPWSERKKLVWWDERRRGSGPGSTSPTSTEDKPPDYVPPDGATGLDAIAGDHPFIMQADGARLALRPAGARGRAAADALRAARVAVPTTRSTGSGRTRAASRNEDCAEDPYNPAPTSRAPTSTRTSSPPTG